LIIDGRRLDAATPGFENVYSFTNGYSGHAPAELFADGRELRLRANHCLVMGDNTENSLDSRYFGDFSRDYVIGKSFFVYWPIGAQDGRPGRFGWAHASTSAQ
jgi:signal peptidase I